MTRFRRFLVSDHAAGWAFILPSVILIVVFGIVPIVWGLVLSFQKAGLISPAREWVGFENYARIASDPKAKQAAINTIYYTLLFVPTSILVSLFIAHALNRTIALVRFYRLAVFIPVVTSTIATGIMFLWLFDQHYGLANWLLGKLGVGPFGFFEEPNQAMIALVLMTVWGWLGFDTIIYLAAMQGVPQQLIEAAAIDGSGRWTSFWRITWPMLGPATLLLVVWSTISALQLFDEVFFVTKGGPLGRTSVVVFYVYRLAFEQGIGGLSLAGLRRGHRVRPLPRDPGAHARAVLARQPGDPLPVMSAITELAGETGMVERPRRRFLPFDPWHLFLAPLAAVMLLPLVWMVVTSLQTEAQTFHFPPILWPGTPQFGNYSTVIRESAFGTWFWNTTVVTTTVVLSNLVLCSLAAYAFARIRFLGRGVVYFLLLATLMVPLQVVLIPTFLIAKDLGLLDHLGALIVPNLVNVFGIFMLTQFFRTLPVELEEAARIDGTSRLGILVRIVLPLSLPALATLAVIQFLWTWNDFLWPLVTILTNQGAFTLQLGLATFQGSHQTQWHYVAAANLMSMLPLLVLFLLAQRYFVRGIATQGLKG